MVEAGAPRTFSKGRIEGISDGGIGFAITLPVSDLAIRPPGTPLQQVLPAWPSYVAYLVSFLTIGAAWLANMAMTDRVTRPNVAFLRPNLLTLLVVTFLQGRPNSKARSSGPWPLRAARGRLIG